MDPAAQQKLSAALRRRAAKEPAPIALAGADLSDARLPRANLVGAELSATRLDHANLSGAKLGRSMLNKALLRWAELNGADFTAADLNGADLSWARVEGACFADADLCGASINGATGEPATIAGARIDKRMCERSHLDDYDIIQLWRAGATIVDLEAFSARVKHACGLAGGKQPESEAGPSSRKLTSVEVKALRDRLAGIDSSPAELAVSLVVPDAAPARAATPARRPAPGRKTPERKAPGPKAPGRNAPGRNATGRNATGRNATGRNAPNANQSQAASPRQVPSQRTPALSMRSMRLVSDVLTPEMLGAPEWRRGDIVMGITLMEIIGSGNAAHVWSGRDQEHEPFAVKLFNSDYAKHGLTLPAYRRGVQVMNRLSTQPKKARLIQLHAVSLNQLGFAMALAANGSAADLPALNWPVDSALGFFEKLCIAIGQAHDAGLLHRCLKPSNILLDDELEPVLTDFDMIDLPGVASRGGKAGGYAVFAAPEELAGDGSQSPTADIYSLGAMLYFLLAGEEPNKPLSRNRDMSAIDHLPNGLVRIIRKCTAAMPADRYQYVRELLVDIRNYENGDEVGISSTRDSNSSDALVSGLSQTRPWMGHSRPPTEATAAAENAFEKADSRSRPKRAASSTLRSTGNVQHTESGPKPAVQPSPRPSPHPGPRLGRKRPPTTTTAGSTNLEKLVGTAGAVLLLTSLLMVEFSPQVNKAFMLQPMRILSVVGGIMMVMLIPITGKNKLIWRLLLAFLSAAVLFFLNLPALFGPS